MGGCLQEAQYAGPGVGQLKGQGRQGVVLTTDETSQKIGDGLSQEAQEWLRDCIITIISK